MSGMETDVPLIKTYVARFAAYAVTESIVTLQELAEPMEQGTYYPLFLLCLQQMLKRKDKDWLVNVFNESKMDLQNMLPGKCTFTILLCREKTVNKDIYVSSFKGNIQVLYNLNFS